MGTMYSSLAIIPIPISSPDIKISSRPCPKLENIKEPGNRPIKVVKKNLIFLAPSPAKIMFWIKNGVKGINLIKNINSTSFFLKYSLIKEYFFKIILFT